MADYYPLIARAVAGLENSTGESRRALYERARTALVAQLRSVDPPLSEQDITRERLSLEEAIRKVESEAARRAAKPAAAKPEIKPAVGANERPRRGDALRSAVQGGGAQGGEASRPRDNQSREPVRRARPLVDDNAPQRPPAPPPPGRDPDETMPSPARQRREAAPRPPLAEQGMRGFRDVVADANDLGRAASSASRAARRSYSEVPSPSGEFDRFEPSLEPGYDEASAGGGAHGREQALAEAERHRTGARPSAPQTEPARVKRRAFPLQGLLITIGLVLVAVGLAFIVTSQWSTISGLFKSAPPPARQVAQPAKDAQPAQPKITDRVGQPGGETVAPVAQRAILYEEDPGDAKGKQSTGSVVWRLENVPVGAGKPPEVAIRADVDFPDRNIKINLSIRRNSDSSLPASHTAELSFTLPQDFSGGGIANVPGILMKSAEQTRGTPLAGLAVKVTDGFFLIGLSNVDTDRQRNIQTLKERGWIDIPIVYANQRRAILVIEKGAPGERVFEQAFQAWGQ